MINVPPHSEKYAGKYTGDIRKDAQTQAQQPAKFILVDLKQ